MAIEKITIADINSAPVQVYVTTIARNIESADSESDTPALGDGPLTFTVQSDADPTKTLTLTLTRG